MNDMPQGLNKRNLHEDKSHRKFFFLESDGGALPGPKLCKKHPLTRLFNLSASLG